MTINHYNITIKGKVQGVSFRKFTKRKADDLNIYGFVKNNSNGNVYIELEGEEDVVQKFLDWCHIGSPLSKVTSVEIERGKIKNFENFQIKQ
jgi:acylphosphatase